MTQVAIVQKYTSHSYSKYTKSNWQHSTSEHCSTFSVHSLGLFRQTIGLNVQSYQVSTLDYSSNDNQPLFHYIPTLALHLQSFSTMIELPEEISAKLTEIIAKEVTREYIKHQQNSTQISTLVPVPRTQPVKIIKTPNMTYADYLTRVLSQPSITKAIGPGGRSSYRLVEDLHIILALARQPNITNKLFDEISRQDRISRSAASIKNRYNEVICHMVESDMKKITEYLEKEGVQGYLVYQNDEIKITLKDPQDGLQGKRPRQEALNAEEKGGQKKAKRNVPPALTELNDVLAAYSRVVNVPIPELLVYLDRTSGDLIALDRYIETRDERLLWTDQEDQLVKSGGSQLEALKKYRTEQSIQARKAYLA